MSSSPNRREFITSSSALLSGSWLWLNLPALATLSACAREAAQRAEPFTTFTPEQGGAMRALTERIIPAGDGVPGADEAGAAWFIDALLGGPMEGAAGMVTAGLADLDERAQAAHNAVFADLGGDQQDAIIREIEDTPFFGFTQFATVMGTFAGEDFGGNRNHAGYRLLQLEHRPAYQPPFGWYDEQQAKGGAA